jgi:hypothetical protein
MSTLPLVYPAAGIFYPHLLKCTTARLPIAPLRRTNVSKRLPALSHFAGGRHFAMRAQALPMGHHSSFAVESQYDKTR